MKLSPFEQELVDTVKKLEQRVAKLEKHITVQNSRHQHNGNCCRVCGLDFGDISVWAHDCSNYKCPTKCFTR